MTDAHRGSGDHVVIAGAGPAGLTAALELVRRDQPTLVLEATDAIGGISQTVERDGWRFDIGGHRFFTKVKRGGEWWHEILSDDEFLSRPRWYDFVHRAKRFDHPSKPMNALRGLGVIEAIRCVASYAWVRVRKPDESNYEGWVASRFGWRLYRHFFKSYTEKVWGMPASEMPADWAAQRIKNLSLWSAVWNALFPKKGQTDITTLIDRFQYPKYGPGMMWERVRDLVVDGGGEVVMEAPILAVHHRDGKAVAVTARIEARTRGSRAGTSSRRCRWPSCCRSCSRRCRRTSSPLHGTCATATSSPSRSWSRRARASPTTGYTSTRRTCGSVGSRTSARGRRTWSRTAAPASVSSTSSARVTTSGRWRTTISSSSGSVSCRRWGSLTSTSSTRDTSCACRRPIRSTTRTTATTSTCCADGSPPTCRTCTPSVATACTSTTTRTTRCTPRCSPSRASPTACRTTSGRSTSRRSTTRRARRPGLTRPR